MADRQVRAVVRALNGFGERVIRKITLDLTANLVETTPVDTGWARANWVPSIGFPRVGPATDSPTVAIVPPQVIVQQAAMSGIFAYRLGQGSVFVTNNVPYIVELNEGKSAQAPTGFVQAAIRKAVTRDIRGIRG